jgi:hypothetical protein
MFEHVETIPGRQTTDRAGRGFELHVREDVTAIKSGIFYDCHLISFLC